MSQKLEDMGKKIAVAEVVHHGEKLTVPEGMTLNDAIDLLARRRDYLEETTMMHAVFDFFPWDGALALQKVLSKKFGWAQQKPTPGFWGDNPPSLINVETGPNEVEQVPWGRMSLPTLPGGYVETDAEMQNGRVCFKLVAEVARRDEDVVRQLFSEVAKYLKSHSIYQGKAIKIRFRDDRGKKLAMPEPKFIDVSGVSKSMLIYSKEVQDSVQTNLFTPIERVEDCIANGIPVKRGIMLGGAYGTGKTLAATVASKLAIDNGLTYIYVPRSDELADALAFAEQYQEKACVVFCEDIDRAMSGERSFKMDDILNILDGIDSKNSRIITVLTTNHLENINPAMLRPGRLDSIIDVTPPDAEAVQRLVRFYGAGQIDPNADMTAVGELLAGTIPAVIAEVVKRAKLSQLSLQEPGTKVEMIGSEAVLEAARTMQRQVNILKRQQQSEEPEEADRFHGILRSGFDDAIVNHPIIQKMTKDLEYIRDQV